MARTHVYSEEELVEWDVERVCEVNIRHESVA
jgi:hypothetical protein